MVGHIPEEPNRILCPLSCHCLPRNAHNHNIIIPHGRLLLTLETADDNPYHILDLAEEGSGNSQGIPSSPSDRRFAERGETLAGIVIYQLPTQLSTPASIATDSHLMRSKLCREVEPSDGVSF